jgi:hypothetical protein
LERIVCHGAEQLTLVSAEAASRGVAIEISIEPSWYF